MDFWNWAIEMAAADPPVDWKGIAYVLAGVVVAVVSGLGLVAKKLYGDLKSARKELQEMAAEQERYLRSLLEHLR
jgi:hypothetical protein